MRHSRMRSHQKITSNVAPFSRPRVRQHCQLTSGDAAATAIGPKPGPAVIAPGVLTVVQHARSRRLLSLPRWFGRRGSLLALLHAVQHSYALYRRLHDAMCACPCRTILASSHHAYIAHLAALPRCSRLLAADQFVALVHALRHGRMWTQDAVRIHVAPATFTSEHVHLAL